MASERIVVMCFNSVPRNRLSRCTRGFGHRMAAVAVMGAIAGLSPCTSGAQHASIRRVDLHIADSVTRLPIPGARVTTSVSVPGLLFSDSVGRATLRLVDGDSLIVHVMASGFRPYSRRLDLRGLDVFSLDVFLAPTITTLPGRMVAATGGVATVSGSGRLADFERRVSRGKGRYIVREDIERRAAVRTSDLFRGMAGLRVVDSGYAKLIVATRSAQLSLVSKSAQNECVMPVVVDGLLHEGSYQVDLLDPKDLHGVEIYVGIGTIPPEFTSMQQNAWCGLIVIWTKAR